MGNQLPKNVERAIGDAPWRLEKGGKHYKLFVMDKFAGVIPMGRIGESSRGQMNLESQVKRILRGEASHGRHPM